MSYFSARMKVAVCCVLSMIFVAVLAQGWYGGYPGYYGQRQESGGGGSMLNKLYE